MYIAYEEPAVRESPQTNSRPWIRVALLCPEGQKVSPEVISAFDSFGDKAAWRCIPESSAASEFDVAFHEVDATTVLIGVPGHGSDQKVHWLPVSVLTAPSFPVLPWLIHAVIAPGVVLGMPVCIDWDDIRYALRDGEQGFIAIVSGQADQPMAKAHDLIASEINRPGTRWLVNSVVSTHIVPGWPRMSFIRTAANFAQSLAPSADPCILLPSLAATDGTSMFAALVIADRA